MRWISALWAGALIHAAAQEGADQEELRGIAGIDLEGADWIDQRIDEATHLACWAATMRALGDPGFPIRFGESFSPDAYDLLGLACKTAENLGEALARITGFLHIWTNTVRVEVDREGATARIVIVREGPRDLAMRSATESAVAEVAQALRSIGPSNTMLKRACFTHREPSVTNEHVRFFACPVTFDAPFDGLEIATAVLDAPMRLADAGLSRYLLSQLEELSATAPREMSPSFSNTLRHAIGDALPNGRPNAQTLAKQLGLSTRTLQRRLKAEGTNLSTLVDETRRTIAEELLRTDRPIAEIAFLVGYSEPSAFHRAFKAWTGRTPRQS